MGTTPPTLSGSAAEPAVAGPRADRSGRLMRYARYSGLLIAILLLVAIYTVMTPPNTFLSVRNGLGMLRAMADLTMVGLGATLVICLGEIDLSFGYVFGLCGTVMAVSWLVWGWPVYLAIVLAFAVAILVGTFNATLVTRAGMPSFIATLGSGALCFGLNLLIGASQNYNYRFGATYRQPPPAEVNWFSALGTDQLPGGFPAQGLWLVAVVVVFFFLLDRSLFGFRLKAIGGNPSAARVARLPVNRYKWFAFVAIAVLACLAAILDFSFIGAVAPDAGQLLTFPVFSAVIIGGASLSGGSGTTFGTVSGALLLAVMANGFAVLAVGGWAQELLLGAIIIVAVAVDRITARRG